MDWTALTDELWEGPNTATTPRASWSHTAAAEETEVVFEDRLGPMDSCDHSKENTLGQRTSAASII